MNAIFSIFTALLSWQVAIKELYLFKNLFPQEAENGLRMLYREL